jgi:hypothetical protein
VKRGWPRLQGGRAQKMSLFPFRSPLLKIDITFDGTYGEAKEIFQAPHPSYPESKGSIA